MRNLASQKYGLDLHEPHLPSKTLEQVIQLLDVLHWDIKSFVFTIWYFEWYTFDRKGKRRKCY